MKIVSLQPSISIILEHMGALDTLIGCTRYCIEAVPALRELPVTVVRDSWSTSADELLALAPDLVIASVPYRDESLAAILKAGFPVLALAPHSQADIYKDIALIAAVAGKTARGEKIVAEMQAAIEAVRVRAAQFSARPLVYCEEWGKPLIHSQLWTRELVEAAGGEFLGQPGKVTTPEAIAEADPDVMVMAWCGAGNRVPLERLVEKRGWRHLKAARRRRIYCIADELLNTPAPTLVDGLRALAAAIHPEEFSIPARAASLRCIAFPQDASKLE